MIRCVTWILERLIVAISHLARGKKFRKNVKFRQHYKKPKFEAFLDPFVCEDVEDA